MHSNSESMETEFPAEAEAILSAQRTVEAYLSSLTDFCIKTRQLFSKDAFGVLLDSFSDAVYEEIYLDLTAVNEAGYDVSVYPPNWKRDVKREYERLADSFRPKPVSAKAIFDAVYGQNPATLKQLGVEV